MNTNPSAKTVLCFGDSNTYGTRPDARERYASDQRWTGKLQQKLGEDYYVIEEGLGGRATNLEHPYPEKPSRNGFTYFKACIDSHMPLDVIIIMLGTNDLKVAFDRSAQDIGDAMRQFPEYITHYCNDRQLNKPRMIIVSPAVVTQDASEFTKNNPGGNEFDDNSITVSGKLSEVYEKLAKETGYEFLDANNVTETGADGIHLTLDSHYKLATSLAALIN